LWSDYFWVEVVIKNIKVKEVIGNEGRVSGMGSLEGV
jgi:hypothetical protein